MEERQKRLVLALLSLDFVVARKEATAIAPKGAIDPWWFSIGMEFVENHHARRAIASKRSAWSSIMAAAPQRYMVALPFE
jgi:hypothetical protein